METAIVQTEVESLPEDASDDQLAEYMLKAESIINIGKAIKEKLEQRLYAKLEQGGEFWIGEVMYYVGYGPKKNVCRNVGETLQLCWELTPDNGDEIARWKEFGQTFLSSNAIKYGAFKKAAGIDAFNAHYDVIEEPKLLTDGKPAKQLQSINTKFIG